MKHTVTAPLETLFILLSPFLSSSSYIENTFTWQVKANIITGQAETTSRKDPDQRVMEGEPQEFDHPEVARVLME
eukprot:CAMPEP_0118658714 /NCGR_PEP_ID=MMETSP0785-20121206/14719_1 /TAXON_ID=91992 /ORGANISM="Bolidomonas pacifica, Strain CCMP 1866" /LENGTH=74 /DNA_ID=CAMNT_0006551757 /DNA_START=203 /DNA_END=427 /DNA_ORIENTATION=-